MKQVRQNIIKIKVALIVCLIIGFTACDTEYTNIPLRDVDFPISIYNSELVHIGKHQYYTGGVSGIVVYRLDETTFLAYDRACPYDWEEGGYVEVVNGIMLYDSLCGSSFNILDGYPYSGSKTDIPLRKYRAIMVDDMHVRICNE